MQDGVDEILNPWNQERPDLDVSPMGVIGQMGRITRYIELSVQQTFAEFGLNIGEFDVMATLRRAGHPYQLSPTALFNSLMISSGAMTNRIDQLEQAGLVKRVPDPSDRRGTLVTLTNKGLTLIDQAVEAHVTSEHQILSVLTPTERETLANLFRKLLSSFEEQQ